MRLSQETFFCRRSVPQRQRLPLVPFYGLLGCNYLLALIGIPLARQNPQTKTTKQDPLAAAVLVANAAESSIRMHGASTFSSTSGFQVSRIILAAYCALEGGNGRDALKNTVSILGTKSRRRGEHMDSEQATTAKHFSSKHGAPSHNPKMQAFAFLVVFTALVTSTVAISTTSRTATRVSNLIERAAEYSNQCSHSTLCTGGLRHDSTSPNSQPVTATVSPLALPEPIKLGGSRLVVHIQTSPKAVEDLLALVRQLAEEKKAAGFVKPETPLTNGRTHKNMYVKVKA
ncbi:hypothetical protein NUW54_g6454 [Trametes sanguinea]|uniref:Uncharacterized protein n=1 Tax=Trametes sanguinea TaxID=158606 RepID=A0ACC1PS65_9APHY|nr:hypothetical protein NUW54_g6454 [Trametes sanguinea]